MIKHTIFEIVQYEDGSKFYSTYTLGGCSPGLYVPSFKNNTWILKLGGSFDNTMCTNPKENSTK